MESSVLDTGHVKDKSKNGNNSADLRDCSAIARKQIPFLVFIYFYNVQPVKVGGGRDCPSSH